MADTNCCQHILQIVLPDQVDLSLGDLLSEGKLEALSPGSSYYVSGLNAGTRAYSERQAPELLVEPAPILAIHIKYAGALGLSFEEELPLGLEIALHALVEVQMVLGQIGEGCNVEINHVDPAQLQPVRADLHNHVLDPLFDRLFQNPDKIQGLGRSPAGRH